MSAPLFADIHCHPTFKPYGQSFTPGNARPDPQLTDIVSLWHEGVPNNIDTRLSERFGVAMYTQSHLSAAALGGVRVLCLSVGALETEFITISQPLPKTITDLLSQATNGRLDLQDFFINLVTRFGKARMDSVRKAKAYWPDLLAELSFVRAQEGKVFRLSDGLYYTFRIAQNGAAMADALEDNAATGAGGSATQPITISIVLTVEGLHNLDAGHGADEATVMSHVQTLKRPANPIAFVTFCHHFWNGLCGQSRSLAGMMSGIFDQKKGEGDGFTDLGLKVLMALLDSGSRRVLIDVKHMSYKARTQYFNLLAGSGIDALTQDTALRSALKAFFRFPADKVPPPIASHAAVSGYADEHDKTYHGNFPAQTPTGVFNPFEAPDMRDDPAINFYDADLLSFARFKGLLGIQLDAHRIAGPAGLEMATARKDPQAWLVWNQVLHMVELWDRAPYAGAWDRICLGSDFDGIISPLQGLRRASDYPVLREGLLYYARLYFMSAADFSKEKPGMESRGIIANRWQLSARNPSGKRLNPVGPNAPEQTSLSPEQIVDKICSGNAIAFLKKHFM